VGGDTIDVLDADHNVHRTRLIVSTAQTKKLPFAASRSLAAILLIEDFDEHYRLRYRLENLPPPWI
jgi:hypothetical protein